MRIIALVLAVAPWALSAMCTHKVYALNITEEVLVTATRTPLSMAEQLRPVSVLNRSDIEAAHASSMLELLQRLPGLQFGRTGGIGSNISLFLRGSNSNHVLVLVDGVRISNANNGAPPWNELLPDQIERIEVVRGPRAALYGSDAVGGVIHIFTRAHSKEMGAHQSVQLSYGNRNTVRSNAQFSYRGPSASVALGLSGYDTQGISHRDSGGLNDKDSARAKTAKLFLRHALGNPDSEIRLNYLRTRSSNEYDDFAPPPEQPPADVRQENMLESLSAVYDYQTTRLWRSTVAFGYSKHNNANYNPTPSFFNPSPGAGLSVFHSKRQSLNWVNIVESKSAGLWLVGAEYYRDSVELSSAIPDDERDNYALFVEYQYFGKLTQWTVFARTDDNEQHGQYNTYGLDWGIDVLPWLKLTASYGESFHAPTFNDLYGFGGNSELEPEEAVNTEIGIRAEHANHRWAVQLFNNEVSSLISIIAVPANTFNFLAFNIDKARIRGAELEYSGQWGALHTELSFSWLDPRNLNNDSILLRRARRELKGNIRYRVRNWDFSAGIVARGRRYDFCASGVDNCLGGYALFNLGASWQWHPQWTMQLQLDNIGAKHYQLASTYNSEERTILYSIRWQSQPKH